MTDNETTTEQLAEIEGQAESTPATEYTPPEGWRVLAVGERLRDGDLWVNHQGGLWPTKRVGETVNDERYIRRIEPQPEPQPEPVQVREGRWKTRGGDIRNVTPTPAHDSRAKRWPWRDAAYDQTWTPNGQNQFNCEESPSDLVEYLGPIEPEPQQPEPQAADTPATEYTPPEGWRVLRSGELLQPGDQWVNWEGTESRPDILHGDGTTASGGRYIRRIKPEAQPEPQPHAAAIEELRSEVSYVQRLLGESRQRVTQLEELVGSLRTINEAQEKTVRLAGQENTDLKHRLDVVSAEWAEQAGMINGLRAHVEAVKDDVVQQRLERNRYQNQVLRLTAALDEKTTQCEILEIELDAAQQVPADSPELRQLRADLEQMTLGRDTYQDGYNRVLGDLQTIRETTKAETVEAIAEWLEPIRLVDSAYLANATMQHLPQIMRTLTGLDSHAID